MQIIPVLLPIREYDRFHSEESGKPFERCIICERDLLNEQVQYLIEKAYRRSPELDAEELLFEFVTCAECLYKVEANFSEESRQHIERFYAEHVDLDTRAATLLSRSNIDVSDWIGTCMVNGTPVEELDEYQLIAHGLGRSLVLTSMPAVLGRAALEELSDGLSEHTLGESRRFRDEYLDLPPELKELLKDSCFV